MWNYIKGTQALYMAAFTRCWRLTDFQMANVRKHTLVHVVWSNKLSNTTPEAILGGSLLPKSPFISIRSGGICGRQIWKHLFVMN